MAFVIAFFVPLFVVSILSKAVLAWRNISFKLKVFEFL